MYSHSRNRKNFCMQYKGNKSRASSTGLTEAGFEVLVDEVRFFRTQAKKLGAAGIGSTEFCSCLTGVSLQIVITTRYNQQHQQLRQHVG